MILLFLGIKLFIGDCVDAITLTLCMLLYKILSNFMEKNWMYFFHCLYRIGLIEWMENTCTLKEFLYSTMNEQEKQRTEGYSIYISLLMT